MTGHSRRHLVVAAGVSAIVAAGGGVAYALSRGGNGTPSAASTSSPSASAATAPPPPPPPLVRQAKVRWTFDTGEESTCSSPAVADGVVYVGSWQGLHALDAATGAARWRHRTDRSITAKPFVMADTVYMGGNDGYLYAVATASGARRWRYRLGESADVDPVAARGVVYGVGGKRIVSGPDDWVVAAFDASTGAPLWRRPSRLWGGLAYADGTLIYLVDGSLYALDARTGTQRWVYETTFAGKPTVVGTMIYLDGTAIRSTDGKASWTRRLTGVAVLGGVAALAPSPDGSRLYVGDREGNLHALDAATGEEIWQHQTGGEIQGDAVATADTVFVSGTFTANGEDGTLTALDAATGDARWRLRTGDRFVPSSPTVAGDLVYIGCSDGKLYALDAAGGDAPETAASATPRG